MNGDHPPECPAYCVPADVPKYRRPYCTCERQGTLCGMVSVWIDDDYLAELTAEGKDPHVIVGWGITIAGESYNSSSDDTEGPVFLGNDGGYESRHVGHWKVY